MRKGKEQKDNPQNGRKSLEVNPLPVESLAKIFSHSVGCLFVLFRVSFAAQKLVSLIRPHWFIYFFISVALGDWSKKILLQFTLKNISPVFSSRNFIVSCLTFRSSNHLEFIFVYGMRMCSNFIDLHVPSNFPTSTCWRNCLHYVESTLWPWNKSNLIMVYDPFHVLMDLVS